MIVPKPVVLFQVNVVEYSECLWNMIIESVYSINI